VTGHDDGCTVAEPCAECAPDLAQIGTGPVSGRVHYPRCELCDGTGEVTRQHPRWGYRDCPEPYETVPCPKCGGGAA
jgi:hypothetical protein